MLCAPAADAVVDGGAGSRMAARMGRGINILGYDGLWEGGLDAPFRRTDFAGIRRAGFAHVRINLHAFQHMDAQNRLDPAILRRLDWAVEGALEAGLVPVVDEHDFSDCQSAPAACADKLRSFWRELAVHYAGRHPDLVFELLNEPGGQVTPEEWNVLAADLLSIIRASNPQRTVIVASLNVEDTSVIRRLRLPEADRNIIVTFHYYKPMRFTHQGAPWAPEFASAGRVEWGSADDEARLRSDFDLVRVWAEETRRPIYLGEFGVYEAAGPALRARWSAFVAREAEARGWPWAIWQFDHDFALFDTDRRRWLAPLLDALIPPAETGREAPRRRR